MAKLQEIELFIEDESQDGVFAISLVDKPAIEEDFIALSKHDQDETIQLQVADEERRIAVGYALIPEKRIYRKMQPKGFDEPVEFNIYFTKETIAKTQELYMRNLNANNATVDHEKPVQDCTVIESWITEDTKHDKINLFNVEPIMGGWAVMMKINNDEVWNDVKAGEYKGFSIEGLYKGFENLKLEEEVKELTDDEKIQQIIKILEDGNN
ncbi:hypothetical protein D8Z79_025775 (plasmid) [Escherichia fergusonii]|uniref:Phage-like element PBSX protein XkdF domain-containing protein n=1 Tax=Lysinibacillus pakistanensis TaxID=759811 RepID=A0ABX6DH17_9BACI|nr:XkdF-like putative serine protease domain-containing protein [Escherichia fergusonii]QCZ35009.1 hypothetical protein D8Z79_025550 [Escherichia fergusonii]QCZ35053.1 hypothetical protein D8Z79_025775 [Escherichia fergusonii]QGG54114.1 hypothetical protein GDS87_24655 [Lysinibacillus pakistanensis]